VRARGVSKQISEKAFIQVTFILHMDSSPDVNPPQPERTSAPLGIQVICAIGVLVSALLVIWGLSILSTGTPFSFLGVFGIALAGGYLIVSYGLWTLKPWGWTLGMIVFIIDGIVDISRVNATGVLISLLFIGYLYTKKDIYRS